MLWLYFNLHKCCHELVSKHDSLLFILVAAASKIFMDSTHEMVYSLIGVHHNIISTCTVIEKSKTAINVILIKNVTFAMILTHASFLPCQQIM